MLVKHACLLLLLVGGPAVAWGQDEDKAGAIAEQKGQSGDPGEPAKGTPQIYSPTPVLDLGEIMQGDVAEGKFVVENRGDVPLVIERVRASCGCTTVQLREDQKTIAPGQSVEIEAKFNSRGRQGQQKKYVTVTSNDPKTNSLRLTLQAMIKTLIEVRPGATINVHDVRPGDLIAQPIDLLPDAGYKELIVESVDINKSGFYYTQEPVSDGDRHGARLRFSVDESAPYGTLNPTVTVEALVGGKKARQTLRIRGTVAGDLRFTPTTVQSTRPTPRGQTLREVSVMANDGKPFEILRADGGPYFDVTIETKNEQDYRISLAPSEAAPDGPFGTWLAIHTTKPAQPVIRIPVFVNVAPRLSVSPPAVLLTGHGKTPTVARRVHLTTARGTPLNVTGTKCDNPLVSVAVVDDPRAPQARKTVEIKLAGEVPPGNHDAMVMISTDVKDAEQVVVPVTIFDPSALEQRQASAGKAAIKAAGKAR